MGCIQVAGRVGVIVSVAVGLVSCSTATGESNGTPAAKTAFAEGERAASAGRFADAAAAFQKAIDADPDFVDAHQRYIETTQRQERAQGGTSSGTRLQDLYERRARERPSRAVYQWALGFLAQDLEKADVHFNSAIAIDPAFARAYFQLAKSADLRGDWSAQREYLGKAAESNPGDPRYRLRYAIAQQTSDPARSRELALQVVEDFPDSPFAAEALYNLAHAAPPPERRAYFDRLRASYPVDRYSYSAAAMSELYGQLADPGDALALAREVAKALPANKTWATRVAYQESMSHAQTLVAGKQFAQALALIDKTRRPSGQHGMTWTLLKAEAAAGAGRVDQAYATVLDTVAATPDARVDAALARYGRELSKSPPDIDADLWRVRDGKATPAAPFAFAPSRGGAPLTLDDFRGQLLLLAFWFPG